MVPYHSPIHPGRVITTFAFISAVVEALNGNGAAYSANQSLPESKQDIGKALLKAALLIQLVIVGLFLLLAGTFHRRCLKAGIRNAKAQQCLDHSLLQHGPAHDPDHLPDHRVLQHRIASDRTEHGPLLPQSHHPL